MKRTLIAGSVFLALLAIGWYVAYRFLDAPMPWPVYATTLRDATFYPSTQGDNDLEQAAAAMLQQQFMGDIGGLCDHGVNCEGRIIMQAGTRVRILKEITLQNSMASSTLAKVKIQGQTGWISSRAIHE